MMHTSFCWAPVPDHSAPLKAISKSTVSSYAGSAALSTVLDRFPTLKEEIASAKEEFKLSMIAKSRASPCLPPPIVICCGTKRTSRPWPSVSDAIRSICPSGFSFTDFDLLRCHWRGNLLSIFLKDEDLLDSLYAALSLERASAMEALQVLDIRILRFKGWSATLRLGGLPHHLSDIELQDLLQEEWGISHDDLLCLPFCPLRSFTDEGVDVASVADYVLISFKSIPRKLQLLIMSGFDTFEAFGTTVTWSWELPPAPFQSSCLLCGHPHHWSVCGLPKICPDILKDPMIARTLKKLESPPSPIKIDRKPNPAAWVSSIPPVPPTKLVSPSPSSEDAGPEATSVPPSPLVHPMDIQEAPPPLEVAGPERPLKRKKATTPPSNAASRPPTPSSTRPSSSPGDISLGEAAKFVDSSSSQKQKKDKRRILSNDLATNSIRNTPSIPMDTEVPSSSFSPSASQYDNTIFESEMEVDSTLSHNRC
jgi:hypothetical protein